MLELSLLYNNIQSNEILCINYKMVLCVNVSPENNSDLKLWLCMCEYRYASMCMYTCMCVHIRVEARGQCWVSL